MLTTTKLLLHLLVIPPSPPLNKTQTHRHVVVPAACCKILGFVVKADVLHGPASMQAEALHLQCVSTCVCRCVCVCEREGGGVGVFMQEIESCGVCKVGSVGR